MSSFGSKPQPTRALAARPLEALISFLPVHAALASPRRTSIPPSLMSTCSPPRAPLVPRAQPACLHYKVAGPEQAAKLPPDFQALYSSGNLHSFLSIPITTDHEVLGALTIAKEDSDGFEVDW